jgi:hypothetical protein
MKDNAARDEPLTALASKLTSAARPVAARYGIRTSWADLAIDLWTVLRQRVASVARRLLCAQRPSDFELWVQCLLAELAEAAYSATLRYTKQRSSLELQMDLYYVFGRVLDDIGRVTLLCHVFADFAEGGIILAPFG